MKKLIIASFLIILGYSAQINSQPIYRDGSSFGFFYSSLSPYGEWIQINGGENVWRPFNTGYDWAPYHYGHWVWTNDGWFWDSDEPYGNIVYHYGRWFNDDSYGWIWIPDYQWAPAWVEWRYDNDYIGWAPLPPYAAFSIGFGIRFTASYSVPYRFYSFLSYKHMCEVNAYNYYVDNNYKYRIYSNSRLRTNYGYSDGRVINRGVDVDFIRQRSGARIVERSIQVDTNPRSFESRSSNESTVRAFILPKNEIDRSSGRNIPFQRGSRSTSLDFSRVTIGNRNGIDRGGAPYINTPQNNNDRSNNPQFRNNNRVQNDRIINNNRQNNFNNRQSFPNRMQNSNRSFNQRTQEMRSQSRQNFHQFPKSAPKSQNNNRGNNEDRRRGR